MQIPLIQPDDEAFAKEELKKFYANGFIPAEKKEFLTDLKRSVGPYLGVKTRSGSVRYILDAASQITTLGLGFNPLAFFGAAYFPESFTDETSTERVKKLRGAYDALLKRQLAWPEVHTFLCHSGAEANEIALGECYENRKNKAANQVLAFEGSFHGRMMVVLAATWNKSKREPFEWKDFTAAYVPYPEDKEAKLRRSFPGGWREAWSQAANNNFNAPDAGADCLLKEEVRCLMAVREQLASKKIFAVIIEPMQCEGGDRFATDRFHTALLLMARAYGVAVVYDEVQTGFHLSEKFFWHVNFDLRDEKNEPLFPDYVTSAKKAQTGVVLSHHRIELEEKFCVASLARGYAQGMMLNQSDDRILKHEAVLKEKLQKLAQEFDGAIRFPRVKGLSFAFDLETPELCNKFIAKRFQYGLMFYPAGDRTLRFRLNLAFLPEDVNALFELLSALGRDVLRNESTAWQPRIIETPQRDPDRLYRAHEILLEAKSKTGCGESPAAQSAWLNRLAQAFLGGDPAAHLEIITQEKWPAVMQAVASLQVAAYEPARRTPIEKFAKALAHPKHVSLGLFYEGHLAGISFAAPLKLFPDERLVDQDPDFQDDDCLYVLDTTVHPDYQGQSFGVLLRYALHLLAQLQGRKKINGRNRDHLARSMWEINLSMGAFEIRHGKNDYPDDLPYRDVIYYSSELAKIASPIRVNDLLQSLVNKVCLSNFISIDFLNDVKKIFDQLPPELRKGYTASGEAEAVDKIVKTIRFNGNQATKLMTFDGNRFGSGSFLARTLSGVGENYFNVERLPFPEQKIEAEILDQIAGILAKKEIQSVWVQPHVECDDHKITRNFLRELKKLCIKNQVPLVYNLSGVKYEKSIATPFALLHDAEVAPDAGIYYFGGQAAVAFCRDLHFIPAPLMMISTWDGDEYSLRRFGHGL